MKTYKIKWQRVQRGVKLDWEREDIIVSDKEPKIGEGKVLTVDPSIFETICEVKEIKIPSYDKETAFNALMKMISNTTTIESQWERVQVVHDKVTNFLDNIYEAGRRNGYDEGYAKSTQDKIHW